MIMICFMLALAFTERKIFLLYVVMPLSLLYLIGLVAIATNFRL
jgi:hypothetical protein